MLYIMKSSYYFSINNFIKKKSGKAANLTAFQPLCINFTLHLKGLHYFLR